MEQLTINKNSEEMRSLRFGGISPVVLRELSGVYQPFVKAVKEIISNAYDADAESVDLVFEGDFHKLTIRDTGSGMNPIEFVRDYIRIGKSARKDELTAIKRRPRIGGKGIGFLAPARYCDLLEVTTKKSEITKGNLSITAVNGLLDIEPYLLQGHGERMILEHIKIRGFKDEAGQTVRPKSKQSEFLYAFDSSVDTVEVEYEFDSTALILTAKIDFELLFSLDASKSLEEIENFCQVSIVSTTNEEEIKDSYTKITLHGIKDFVRKELLGRGKKGARNMESTSGIDQFLWNLSRIIPVKANLHPNLPEELSEFVQIQMDGEGEDKKYPIQVNCFVDSVVPKPLERHIIQPTWKMDMSTDKDLIRVLEYGDEGDGVCARGFLIGQTSTIFPAECRGILLRVKGVAIGEPTYFGLDQILTGSAKVALSQISGEINILSGIDAIHDINPGRDGFYKESEVYNLIRKNLIGDTSVKIAGDLKEVIDAIITRSEVNASIHNFVKKHDAQRKAILEASATIAELSYDNPEIVDEFFVQKSSYELALSPVVQYKAEGKLASYSVKIVDDIDEQYKIDYVQKELLLSSKADIWKRNINIGGNDFDIQLKQGKQKPLFCEVNPKASKIYINWDHPMRGTMGDAGFIKHCLATVASALPQEQLLTYIRLITNKI